MSRTYGRLCRITVSPLSNAAAMQGKAEFFAPLIETRPRNSRPPVMRNLSMSGQIRGNRPAVKVVSNGIDWSASGPLADSFYFAEQPGRLRSSRFEFVV